MRVFNRAHVPWALFVLLGSIFAVWLYLGNFEPHKLPSGLQLPKSLVQEPSSHRSVGGTPLGLIFGAIAFVIFIFAGLLGVRKKLVLWRVGTVQRWMRAHIWLTLLTIPLVALHSGFRLGGPMTTLLVILYVIVMASGVYGLVLQHQMPRIMMERLPAESVFEQIPHIRQQLQTAAQKMLDSLKPAASGKTGGGAAASSPAKAVTAVTTPTARAKMVVGSTITAESVAKRPVAAAVETAATETKPEIAIAPSAAAVSAGAADAVSEATLVEFLDRQILPYLAARNGKRMRLGNARFSEDTFRFLKLRVTETYRARVTEMQAWCDERRMLDLQVKLHHWLHSWLFVHVPISFALLLVTAWHAYMTLFYY